MKPEQAGLVEPYPEPAKTGIQPSMRTVFRRVLAIVWGMYVLAWLASYLLHADGEAYGILGGVLAVLALAEFLRRRAQRPQAR
jgi:hypothetical protein